jgi:heptosyltransferase-2
MQHPGILILKTAALGDVLRTTSILPGIAARHPGLPIVWATAPSAVDLVRTHPRVAQVVEVGSPAQASLAARRWEWVISLDDEPALCALASSLQTARLSGAHLRPDGSRAYTPDVAPWFDMGLLSVHGKAQADRLKILNTHSHPRIYAQMLGIEMGKPALVLPDSARAGARAFVEKSFRERLPLLGLNTGAGGRWVSKQLSVERTVELAGAISEALGGKVAFLLLGGEAEAPRHAALAAGLQAHRARPVFADAGNKNALLDFAARVELCSLLVTSDSLALHMAVALDRRLVAFFAPTSAAEIELYDLGEKVVSTAADYCSYRPDADNSSITVERLLPPCLWELRRALGA